MAVAPLIGMRTPVVCLEGQPEVWELACLALDGQDGYVLLSSPAVFDQLVSLSERIGPAILLTSLKQLTPREIRRLCIFSTLRVMVVASSNVDNLKADDYIRNGLSGILSLTDGPEVWRKAVRSVAAGELWVPRQIAARVLRALLQLEQPNESRKLTAREAQILELIASGCNNRDIAKQLFITKETVRWHLRSLYAKIGARDRASAIKLWHWPESSSIPRLAKESSRSLK